jgi:D-serine deaminase-like pyridoxal phosphate-dependent protein
MRKSIIASVSTGSWRAPAPLSCRRVVVEEEVDRVRCLAEQHDAIATRKELVAAVVATGGAIIHGLIPELVQVAELHPGGLAYFELGAPGAGGMGHQSQCDCREQAAGQGRLDSHRYSPGE